MSTEPKYLTDFLREVYPEYTDLGVALAEFVRQTLKEGEEEK